MFLLVSVIFIVYCYSKNKKRKEKKEEIKEEKKKTEEDISNLELRNKQLEEQRNSEEIKFQEMLTQNAQQNKQNEKRLKELKDEKLEYIKKLDNLEEICKEQKDKIQDMKRNQITIKLSNESDELSIKDKNILMNYIKKIRQKYPDFSDIVSTVKGKIDINKLMHITVQSDDQSIKCIVICKKNDIFNNVINKIYEDKPEFKEYKHYFLGNGMTIEEYKSIEENNIKDGNGITINKLEIDQ